MAQPPAYAGLRSRSSGPNATDRRAITDDLLHAAVRLAGDDANMLARIEAIVDPPRDPPTMLDAALGYAARGIGVFPLVPGEKRPLVKHGLHEATTDTAQVAAWWARWPQANIGVATGHLFDCIDIDGPPGYRSLADLRDAGLVPPVLGKVHTARGGQHLFILPTGDGNAAGVWPGVDYRGKSGYVVAPPSLSATTGRRWTWVQELVLA